MNNRRAAYYPALFYVLVLIVLWLVSWFMSVFQLLSGTDATVVSLVSGEGVRWVLLNVHAFLGAAPWGCVVFLMLVTGLLSGSGLLQLFAKLCALKKISNNELHSFLFALSVLLLYVAIVFMFTVSPWHTLLGVTGELSSSPLARGWMLVLFVGVLVMSLVYGFIYGNYRTLVDVVASAGDFAVKFMPALLAVLPATCIMPCLQYSGIDVVYGLSVEGMGILSAVIYLFPFVYILFIEALDRF